MTSSGPVTPSTGDGGATDTVVSNEPTYRVVVVDDYELLRAGTRRILDEAEGLSVVGEANDGESALEVIDRFRPDVVLVDIRLPTINGIELAARVVRDHPSMTVLILSAYDDEDYVRAALSAGVSGYLLKTTPGHELVGAIRTACGGTTVLDKAVSARLLGTTNASMDSHGRTDATAAGSTKVGPLTAGPLTVRECDVVRLVARGLANKAIGNELGISPRTVEGHLNHVFEKLGTTSRTELVHYALTNGLIAHGIPASGDPSP